MNLFNRSYAPLFMWVLSLSFFAYQFVLRLWPSLNMQIIMQQFAIDATSFGLLASVYYYGYAGMQIPLAIALDRYNPRYVVGSCILLTGLAMFAFSVTDNWYIALITRCLIGMGSAVAFLGTSKVISQCFPKSQYSKMIGLTFTIGLIGAIYGGKPIGLLIEKWQVERVAFMLAIVAVSIAACVFMFLRLPKGREDQIQESLKLKDFKKLLRSPKIWLLGVANLLMVGFLEGFADVWGINYLMVAYDMTKSDAAELTSLIFVGMLFGGPLLAVLGKKFGNYNVITGCGVGMALVFCQMVLSKIDLNWYALAVLFFLIGIMCCYQVLIFTVGGELVSERLLGVTVAFLNCINMLGGSFFHIVIGYLMDISWGGETINGMRKYNLSSYDFALMILPICSLIGAAAVAVIGFQSKKVVKREAIITKALAN